MNASAKLLPASIAKLLRGEFNAPSEWVALTDLGRDYYRDGKAGRAYVPTAAPVFPTHVAETVDRFLLCCWKQGRQAAKRATA